MKQPLSREPAPSRRLLIVSPHLDDAVFACGRLLAAVPDSVVATVFAGAPPPGAALTEWDRAAGFAEGEDVVAARREEDRQALAALGAWPLWLDFRDRQYGEEPQLAAVVGELRYLLMQCLPDTVLFPLGLFHSDHRLAREAALVLLERCPSCRWLAYEDALYRCLPEERDQALARLAEAGLQPQPVRFAESAGAGDLKAQAVACYRSQLTALATPGRPGPADLAAAEGYWQLGRGDAAWT